MAGPQPLTLSAARPAQGGKAGLAEASAVSLLLALLGCGRRRWSAPLTDGRLRVRLRVLRRHELARSRVAEVLRCRRFVAHGGSLSRLLEACLTLSPKHDVEPPANIRALTTDLALGPTEGLRGKLLRPFFRDTGYHRGTLYLWLNSPSSTTGSAKPSPIAAIRSALKWLETPMDTGFWTKQPHLHWVCSRCLRWNPHRSWVCEG